MLNEQPQKPKTKKEQYSTTVIVFLGLLALVLLPIVLLSIVLALPFLVIGYAFFGFYRLTNQKHERQIKLTYKNNTHPEYLKFRYQIEKMRLNKTSILDKTPIFKTTTIKK